MCDPLSLASFAVGAAQSVVGYVGSVQQANAQNKYNAQLRAETIRATMDRYGALANKQSQESRIRSQELFDNNIKAVEARAAAANNAGDAGVYGISVDSLIGDYNMREARYDTALDMNYQMNRAYLIDEQRSTMFQGQGRLNSIQDVAKPSFLDAGLRIASAGVSAWGNSLKMKQPGYMSY